MFIFLVAESLSYHFHYLLLHPKARGGTGSHTNTPVGKKVLIERFQGTGRPKHGLLSVCGWHPLTLQPFNSCAFPTWPLQILIHGLYNCADFWKRQQENVDHTGFHGEAKSS